MQLMTNLWQSNFRTIELCNISMHDQMAKYSTKKYFNKYLNCIFVCIFVKFTNNVIYNRMIRLEK